MKWAGHVVRMDEDCTTKKVFNIQSNGTQRKGRQNLKWIVGLEKDILVLKTKNWRTLAGRRLAWKRPQPTLGCQVTEHSQSRVAIWFCVASLSVDLHYYPTTGCQISEAQAAFCIRPLQFQQGVTVPHSIDGSNLQKVQQQNSLGIPETVKSTLPTVGVVLNFFRTGELM
ncbi:uncharacterized protein TNCV_753351 [Trichonephila clavipes]|nr:uncharacterized protein TNCV_753351 [Trichonephila clavipes]